MNFIAWLSDEGWLAHSVRDCRFQIDARCQSATVKPCPNQGDFGRKTWNLLGNGGFLNNAMGI